MGFHEPPTRHRPPGPKDPAGGVCRRLVKTRESRLRHLAGPKLGKPPARAVVVVVGGSVCTVAGIRRPRL